MEARPPLRDLIYRFCVSPLTARGTRGKQKSGNVDMRICSSHCFPCNESAAKWHSAKYALSSGNGCDSLYEEKSATMYIIPGLSSTAHSQEFALGKNVPPAISVSTAFSSDSAICTLLMYPLAPADFASRTISSPACIERIKMGSGVLAIILFAALNPSRTGIVTSRITRSGFSSAAFCMASSPLRASPQTIKSFLDSRMEQTPRRTTG
jgi:hypothetical protein